MATDFPTDLTTQIDSFVPAGNPPGWRRVAGEVRAAVAQVTLTVTYPAAELMGVLTKLALFADAEGYPLQASLWLSREYIERFIAIGCAHLGEATRANYRSKLLRLREALLGGDCRTGTPAKLSGSAASRPYTAAERAALWAWASGQPTEELRSGLTVLLALGLGCGLDSSEVIPLRVQDVSVATAHAEPSDSDENPLIVAVRGRRARLVVCRRPWERVLTGQARHARQRSGGSAGYLFRPNAATRGGNIVTNFIARSQSAPDTPPLKTTRLRSTWLVDLIEAGLPLPVIVAAAGLGTLHSLSRVLPYVRGADPASAVHLLRGSS